MACSTDHDFVVHSTDDRKAELVKCQHGRKKVTDTKSLSIKISASDCTYRHSKIRLTLLWIPNVFHQLFGYARAKFGQLTKMQSHLPGVHQLLQISRLDSILLDGLITRLEPTN